MSKCGRNVVVVLLTLFGAAVGVLLGIFCFVPKPVWAGLIGGGIVFSVSWVMIFLYRLINRFITFSFIPRIDIRVTMSEDGGRTYSELIHSIPRNRDIYLKYEISAGTNFPRCLLSGMFTCFNVNMDENTFVPCDYSGVYDTNRISYQINALANRKKVNITLRLPAALNTRDQYTLEVEFVPEVLQVYNRTIVLYTTRSENCEYSPQLNFICSLNVCVWTEQRRSSRRRTRRRRRNRATQP